MENWKPIGTHDGLYEVSDLGRVRSVARRVWVAPSRQSASGYYRPVRERILKPSLSDGRPFVVLWREHEPRTAQVSVLVLEAFVGPRPSGRYACHEDDVPTNNRLDNLAWKLPVDNSADKIRNGNQPYGTSCRSARLDEETVKNIREARGTQAEIACRFGTTQGHVSRIRGGVQRRFA